MSLKELTNKINLFLFTQFVVDKDSKTFRMTSEGFFGENLTRAYYTLKGYSEIVEDRYSQRS